MIVTTSTKENPLDCSMALEIAKTLNAPYVARSRISLSQLGQINNAAHIVIIRDQQPFVRNLQGELFFHPGMSALRILNRLRGQNDNLIAALGLRTGMSLLDCTVGTASDALLSAYEVGRTGYVVGVESMPLIALVTRYGLQKLVDKGLPKYPELSAAASRIRILRSDHQSLLQNLPENSFDVVYFDPMFRVPKNMSSGIRPLREFADSRPLRVDSIKEALRVARSRVVVKEAAGSREFERLGVHQIVGGNYSTTQYGLIFKEDFA